MITEREYLPPADSVRDVLAYAGLVLIAYELVKGMIVRPIKAFYEGAAFSPSMMFKSYEQDVLPRHSNEFQACLLYLRDFMRAIDTVDVETIEDLRKHRNELAHDLANRLPELEIDTYAELFERVHRTLFRLSNYRMRMELGADPAFASMSIDWDAATGGEYVLFEHVFDSMKLLARKRHGA